DDFFVTEADNLPMAGIYRGRNALKELFTKVMGLMDVAGLERVQTLVGGDYAVTYLSFRFADPALKSAELCELFRFRDGKCCEIKPFYFDPATVHAAVAAKQAALTA
ncbi:MAG TPA: nuclear transport factor 2 family protein, partial [Novosphingobium sp.]|nr:nuclear transport factor 2 family protein [Novosphingobium sp.]